MIEQNAAMIGESKPIFDSNIPGARHVWECNEEVFLKRLAMAHGDIWRARYKLPWPEHPVAWKSVMIAGLSEDKGLQSREYLKRLQGIPKERLTKEVCWKARNLPPTV